MWGFTEVKPYGLDMAVGTAAATQTSGTLERLAAASHRLAVLDTERRAEQARRDELIIEARDLHLSWRTIARAAMCSISRCVAIVGGG
jgi:hypothetical protein